ncbi:MAG TPA: glycosyltransferase family 2 protein [Vicinamibacteria bacterium]|nr:glycosyltransferase family 2 protein [Vicinamibacteria bacterium]
MDSPFVTIAIPCLDEEGYIEACLRDVLDQDYPKERIEVLLADGGSRDATRTIVNGLARADHRLRIIENPRRIQAAGLNAAIREAKGDVILRMDVHCRYATDYVRCCVEALDRTEADNVGGAQRPLAQTPFQRALAAALGSALAVGGASYRSPAHEGFVDTVFLGAFRRRIFERVGLYDPGAITNEDAELNQRILEAGGRIYLSADIVVHYFPRETLTGLARQYYKYGRGRARTLLQRGRLPTLRPLAPVLFVLGVAALALVPPLHPLAPWALALYALVALAEAIRVGRSGGGSTPLVVAAIFPVMHCAHGIGFLAGLARYGFWPDWAPAERLPPRPPLC